MSRKIIKNLLRPVLMFLGFRLVRVIQSVFGWRVMKEVSAKVNYRWAWRSCMGGCIGQAAAQIWSFMNQTAARIQGRDLREPVSSFYLGDGRGSMTRFILLPRLSRCPGMAGNTGLTGRTTIAAHGAFSAGRVRVGRG